MKHILNNLTEQEKNAIREQHTGGMKVATDKFSQLLESKLGDVKPILSEQPTDSQKIQLIQIKVGDALVDLNMMEKTSQGANFYGWLRANNNEYLHVLFNCGEKKVAMRRIKVDRRSFNTIESPKQSMVSPAALSLLNKAAGCDAYVKNQDSSVDDVTLAEQNRTLWKRRFVKITNTEGKTLLFDVTEVETNSEGCKFTGDFRGNYDSVASFLGFEDLKSFIGITSNTQGKAHSFKFDCSAPATIMLNDADDMTYSSNPDGSSKFVGKSVKYTLDTEGQKELSNLCKCSRYK